MIDAKFDDFLVRNDKTIKEALSKISLNANGLVFVADKNSKAIGVVTDGDIRRALVNGAKTSDSVDSIVNKSFRFANNICEAKRFAKDYKVIPILREDKSIKMIIGKDFIIPERMLTCPVVIQAGGLGTRLYPYTKILPKPLIPVGDYPIIELIMRRFEEFGCKKFYIIVNHKKEMIKSYFAENKNKYDITFVDETTPLGTAGGLSLLKGMINEPFILANCDTFLDCDFYDCFEKHIETQNDITMISAKINFKIPYGIINVNENDQILELKEKPQLDVITNVGVYVINSKIIDNMEENQKIHMPEVCEQYMKTDKCGTFIISEDEWNDMGELDKLNKMMERN